MATGSKVPFRELKEGDEEEFEEEAEEGFFQKALTLPFSWFLSRRLWLGPQCSKLPLLSCCGQLPPAGPPGDGDGWLKSFQRSRRICFTSKSFRPEPDMLDTRKEETLAGSAVDGPADGGGQRRAGLEKEAGCALCTQEQTGRGGMRVLPGNDPSADRRATQLSCGQVHGTRA